MLVISFRSFAQPADDAIVPDNMVASMLPNSGRLFFIKLVVTVRTSHPQHGARVRTRHVFEFSAPCDEETGLNTMAWASLIGYLAQVDSPVEAFTETIFRVTFCVGQMLSNPSNAGRMVLPLEVFVLLNKDERQMAPVAKVDVEEEGVVCTVCMDDIEIGSKAGRLPCMHLFHETCINQWLPDNYTCPNCRLPLV